MIKSNFRKIYFIVLFIFSLASAQLLRARTIDSLKLALKNAKEDTNKVLLLTNICSQHGVINDEEALKYSKQALELSAKLNYPRGKIKACIHLGESYSNKGDYQLAKKYLNEALAICNEIKENGILLAKVNIVIAGIYTSQGDYDNALDLYLRNIKIIDNKVYKHDYAKVLQNIAIIYYHTFQFDKSETYAIKAKGIFEELKDTISVLSPLNILAAIYYARENYPKALSYYQNLLERSENLGDKSSLINSLCGIGIVYADTKKYSDAIIYFNRALNLAKETDEKQSITTCLLNLGICYSGVNNQKEAINLYSQSLVIAKKIGSKHSIKEVYYFMTEAYEKMGDYKAALNSLQQFALVNDSIYNEESSKQINDLSAKYETEKKEKEIAVLNNELILKERDRNILNTQVQQRNGIIIGTIIGSALILLIVILLFNRRRLLSQHKFQEDLNLQREKSTIDIMHAQEDEQARIAKDLHDGVGIYLSTIKLNLQLYEKYIPSERTAEYQSSLKLIDTISSELRNIMKNLSNEVLQEYGLISAFEELVTRVNSSGIVRIEFLHHGVTKRLNEVTESNLYRIGQELITNCVKYANANHASLQLLVNNESITLMLEDNGVGFDVTKNTAGMGIKNIHKRAKFMNGTVRFESSTKNGTLCVIEIPNKL